MQRHVFSAKPRWTSLPAWAHPGRSRFGRARLIERQGKSAQVAWRHAHFEQKPGRLADGLFAAGKACELPSSRA